jgi:hypothetical protein
MATTRKQRRSLAFLMALSVVLYGILSFAIAISTANTCGDYSAAKTWNVAPPAWECD